MEEGLPLNGGRKAPHKITVVSASLCLFAMVCIAGVALHKEASFDKAPPKQRSSLDHHHDDVAVELKKFKCDKGFRSSTLKTAFEVPMVGLFQDTGPEDIFEASSVTIVDGMLYVICDSSWRIYAIHPGLPHFSSENYFFEPENDRDLEGDSGYEAIFHVTSNDFVVVRESILADHMNTGEAEYRAVVEEITLNREAGTYSIVRQCPTEKVFEGDSKGFEGAMHAHSSDGTLYILALCEGNYCAEGDRGMEPGHGVIVLMRREINEDGSCVWKTVKELAIPESAYFTDYSAITMHRKLSKVAISSQMDSRVWIGDIHLFDETGAEKVGGTLDVEKSYLSGGEVLDFPRNADCQITYCNVEGLHFISPADPEGPPKMLVAVSDRMKKLQDFRCFHNDQSIHVFVLPHGMLAE